MSRGQNPPYPPGSPPPGPGPTGPGPGPSGPSGPGRHALIGLQVWATGPGPGNLGTVALATIGAAAALVGYAVLCVGIAAATVIPAQTVGLVALIPLMFAGPLIHALVGDPR